MDKYYGAATLSIVDESSVLKYLILDADLIHHSHEISFSVIVNNLYFYSGIMYTDGGTTAWGQIQQRNAGNNAGNLFSFYFERGADPVLKKLGSGDSVTKTFNSGVFSKSASGTINVSGYRYVLINSIQIGNPNASSSSSGRYSFGDISADFRRSPASYDNPARMPNWFDLNGREVIQWSYNSSDNDNMIVSYTLVE